MVMLPRPTAARGTAALLLLGALAVLVQELAIGAHLAWTHHFHVQESANGRTVLVEHGHDHDAHHAHEASGDEDHHVPAPDDEPHEDGAHLEQLVQPVRSPSHLSGVALTGADDVDLRIVAPRVARRPAPSVDEAIPPTPLLLRSAPRAPPARS